MHPEDRADSLRTDRHDRGFCDGCGEIPDVCTCTDDGLCPDCQEDDS